jgi:hypothetical protein
LSTVAPVTSDVLWIPQGGERSQLAFNKARALDESHERRVLHLVQRPVHANHHSTGVGIPITGDAFETASRSGKPVKAGGTGTGAGANRASCGSPPATASARKRARQERKGRRSRPPSLRGSRARVWLPACRKNAVAEVGRRRLVPNTLGKRALKKGGQGRVNGGLARSERRRVKLSASASGERTSRGRAHRTKTGAQRPRPRVT